MLCLSFLFGYITVSIIAMAEHSAGMGVFFFFFFLGILILFRAKYSSDFVSTAIKRSSI